MMGLWVGVCVYVTCGRDSMLCPLIFTTVSDELEVDELTSFTTSPAMIKTKQAATVKNKYQQ